MNGPGRPPFLPFYNTQSMHINVHVDQKIFYHQRIVYMFGPERLGEILELQISVIIPIINYEMSFDVTILILY